MKVVLITGVSRGIGKALAQKFLDNGDFVVGTSTTGKTDWSHDNLTVFSLDLSQPESIEQCVKEITLLKNNFDIIINNAAIWSGREVEEPIDIAVLRKTLEVDLFGVIDFSERIISLVNEGGHIVNISSRAGSMSQTQHAMYPDYKIAKAGINMFTRILSARLKNKITVSAVHPGWVKTDMGGMNADVEPEEAAENIFKLANSKVESGQFWFKQEKFPW